MAVMSYVLVILASLIGLAGTAYYCKKNVVIIQEKNKNEPKKYKRVLNYALTVLWYGYLTLFFLGLIVNNFIF